MEECWRSPISLRSKNAHSYPLGEPGMSGCSVTCTGRIVDLSPRRINRKRCPSVYGWLLMGWYEEWIHSRTNGRHVVSARHYLLTHAPVCRGLWGSNTHHRAPLCLYACDYSTVTTGMVLWIPSCRYVWTIGHLAKKLTLNTVHKSGLFFGGIIRCWDTWSFPRPMSRDKRKLISAYWSRTPYYLSNFIVILRLCSPVLMLCVLSGHFSVMCYNVLCSKYATRQMYGYCPPWALEWEYRKKGIITEIRKYDTDIITLQVRGISLMVRLLVIWAHRSWWS